MRLPGISDEAGASSNMGATGGGRDELPGVPGQILSGMHLPRRYQPARLIANVGNAQGLDCVVRGIPAVHGVAKRC